MNAAPSTGLSGAVAALAMLLENLSAADKANLAAMLTSDKTPRGEGR